VCVVRLKGGIWTYLWRKWRKSGHKKSRFSPSQPSQPSQPEEGERREEQQQQQQQRRRRRGGEKRDRERNPEPRRMGTRQEPDGTQRQSQDRANIKQYIDKHT
jgi:hypothetical protein